MNSLDNINPLNIHLSIQWPSFKGNEKIYLLCILQWYHFRLNLPLEISTGDALVRYSLEMSCSYTLNCQIIQEITGKFHQYHMTLISLSYNQFQQSCLIWACYCFWARLCYMQCRPSQEWIANFKKSTMIKSMPAKRNYARMKWLGIRTIFAPSVWQYVRHWWNETSLSSTMDQFDRPQQGIA